MPSTSTPVPAGSPLANLRDLGGIPVGGGSVRPGVLWRADDVSCVTAEWAQQATADGLNHVVDLRSVAEAGLTGRGPLGALPVCYHHVPVIDAVGGGAGNDPQTLRRMLSAGPEQVGSMYLTMLRAAAPSLVSVLGMLAAASGTTVVHCAAGKDRTGIAVAVVLSVLGAADDVIAADYAATSPNLPGVYARIVGAGATTSAVMDEGQAAQVQALLAAPVDTLPASLGAYAATMRAMLDQARAEDGGVVEVLRGAGLTDSLSAALRRRMVA